MKAAPDVRRAPSLRLEGLEIRKGGRPIVSGLELRQEPGSVLWVVGPNGAGKSSLLRCLAGLERPHAGRVVRGGGRGHVLYDPDMRLPPSASAGAWLRLCARLTGAGPASGDGYDVGGAPALAGIRAPWISAARSIGALSTGEEKRLILETLLSTDADFVFLDEPFSHLSSDGRSALLALLDRRRERSVVVVATNRPPPKDPADRVLRLGGAE